MKFINKLFYFLLISTVASYAQADKKMQTMNNEEFYKNEKYENVITIKDFQKIKEIRTQNNFINNKKQLQANLGYYSEDIQICFFKDENELLTRFKEADELERRKIIHLLETVPIIQEKKTFDCFKTLFEQFYVKDSNKFEILINIVVKQKFTDYEDYLIDFYNSNFSQNFRNTIVSALINTKYEKKIFEDYLNKSVSFMPIVSFVQSKTETMAMVGLDSLFSSYEIGKISTDDFCNQIDLNNQYHLKYLVKWREKNAKGSNYIESVKTLKKLNVNSKFDSLLLISCSYFPLNKQDKLYLCQYLTNKENSNLLLFIKKLFNEDDIEEVYKVFVSTIFKNKMNTSLINEKILKFETHKLLRLNSKSYYNNLKKSIQLGLFSKQVNFETLLREINEKSSFYLQTGDFGNIQNDNKTSFFSLNILLEKYIFGFSILFTGNNIENLFFNHNECVKHWSDLSPAYKILKDYELKIIRDEYQNLKISLLKDKICFITQNDFDGINLNESLIPLYNCLFKYENLENRLFPSKLYSECAIFMTPDKYFQMIDILR